MSVDQLISNFGGLTEEYEFYDGEVILHYEPRAHQYLLAKDGDLIPQEGVTNVCHIIDKSHALVPWACKMMAAKLLAEGTIRLPDGQVIARQMSTQEFENLVLSAKDAHKEKLEEAGDVGHIAHAWIERYIKAILAHGPDSIQVQETLAKFPEDERATNCCLASLEWMRAHNVRWLGTERKIYSLRYGYAGTMDGLCLVDSCTDRHCCKATFKDRLTISDWKTSNYLYIEYLLQTAAYMQAYNEEEQFVASRERREAMLAIDRWVIRLGKEDGDFSTWHAPAEDYTLDIASFITALALKRRTEAIQKRVKDREATTRESIRAERRAAKEAAELAEKQRKAEERAQQKIDREAALRIKCVKADKFKGTRFPKCNGGNDPCDTCLAKYLDKKRLKHSKPFDYSGPCNGDHAAPVCGSVYCWRADYETRPERLLPATTSVHVNLDDVTIGHYCSWMLSSDENGNAVMVPADHIIDAMLAAPAQCDAEESGGTRCELDSGHTGKHWISQETIHRRLGLGPLGRS